MPRGIRRDRLERLQEELLRTNAALEKSSETVRELQVRKKELEKEIEMCENESLLDLVQQSGLSVTQLKAAIESYTGQVADDKFKSQEQETA